MRLVAVRHLTTEWNRMGRLQGRRNMSVEAVSEQLQFELRKSLATVLRDEPPDAVVVSEMTRTQETAEIFGFDTGKVEPLLNELDFGRFEGRTRDDLIRETAGMWVTDPSCLTLGEPVANLACRVRQFVEGYGDRSLVLAFAHGAWMRALHALAANEGSLGTMNRVELPNHSILSVHWTDSGFSELKVVLPVIKSH